MDPLLILIGFIAALNFITTVDLLRNLKKGTPSETMLNIDKRAAEIARRLAVVMAHFGVADEATKNLEDLMKVKLQEAKEVIKGIDAVVETRKLALTEDLKRIEAELLGKK